MASKEIEQNLGIISEVTEDNETLKLLLDAKTILRRIVEEEAGPAELDEFLESSGRSTFLTQAHPSLKGDSPLAALRKAIDREKSQELTTPQANPKHKRYPQREPQPNLDNQPLRRFVILSTKEDLGYVTENTKAVHLVRQELINVGSVRQILDACPELHTIQVAPSNYARLISHSLKELLEDNEVKIRKGRVADYQYYDQYPKQPDFYKKVDVFKNIMLDSEKRVVYEHLRHYNFVEVEISELYFGEKRMTIREIAKELEMQPSKVQTKLAGLLHWAGYPAQNDNSKISISASLRRLKSLMDAEKDK